jgi:hypothetical protein
MTYKEIEWNYRQHFDLTEIPKLGKNDIMMIEWAEQLINTPKSTTECVWFIYDMGPEAMVRAACTNKIFEYHRLKHDADFCELCGGKVVFKLK